MLLFYCIFNLINVACVSLFSKTFLIIKKIYTLEGTPFLWIKIYLYFFNRFILLVLTHFDESGLVKLQL